jgi:hypothetical protein
MRDAKFKRVVTPRDRIDRRIESAVGDLKNACRSFGRRAPLLTKIEEYSKIRIDKRFRWPVGLAHLKPSAADPGNKPKKEVSPCSRGVTSAPS